MYSLYYIPLLNVDGVENVKMISEELCDSSLMSVATSKDQRETVA